MGVMLWIVFGVAAGLTARWIMPGPDPIGLIGTVAVGIGGALLGGLLGTLGGGSATEFDLRTALLALIGALVVLFCHRAYSLRTAA